MASSWTCAAIYLWTLFVPRCLSKRDFSTLHPPRRRHQQQTEPDGAGIELTAPTNPDEQRPVPSCPDEAEIAHNELYPDLNLSDSRQSLPGSRRLQEEGRMSGSRESLTGRKGRGQSPLRGSKGSLAGSRESLSKGKRSGRDIRLV